jgi:pimeloyl-ACP methyl ester carboxylesterase
MPEEERNDFTLAYQDSCSGPTILLIHGFPLNSSLWESQIDDLSDTARVLAPDLRGFGLSEATPAPYSMEMMADDCMGLLDSLGIQEPVIVCGLSMGGYVALEFYRRFSDWVGGLILVATRAGADDEAGRANRDKMIASVRKSGVEPVTRAMLPKLLALETYERNELLVNFVREMVDSCSPEGLAGALEAMKTRPDSTPMLADISVPVLIIHGEVDQIIPVSEAEAMRDAISDARLVVLPGAGHLPNLEQTDAFNEAIWEFLQRLEDEGE